MPKLGIWYVLPLLLLASAAGAGGGSYFQKKHLASIVGRVDPPTEFDLAALSENGPRILKAMQSAGLQLQPALSKAKYRGLQIWLSRPALENFWISIQLCGEVSIPDGPTEEFEPFAMIYVVPFGDVTPGFHANIAGWESDIKGPDYYMRKGSTWTAQEVAQNLDRDRRSLRDICAHDGVYSRRAIEVHMLKRIDQN